MAKRIQTVADIPADWAFIQYGTDDAAELRERFEDDGEDFGSFFVRVVEGEIVRVYGMDGIVPVLDKPVYRVA